MKYNDTYSMIGVMLNQGFETEFKKARDKKEKHRRVLRKLIAAIARLKKTSDNIKENTSGNDSKCRCDERIICVCTVDCCDRV